MEKINSELTKKEQDILEHRGFYVKNNITFYNMIASAFILLIVHYLVGFLYFIVFFGGKDILPYSQIPLFALMIIMLVSYVFQGKRFYGSENPKATFFGRFVQFCTNETNSILKTGGNHTIFMFILTLTLGTLSIKGFVHFLTVDFNNYGIDPDWYLRMMLTITLGFYVGGFILRQLVEIFHPLYSFGNIGEKIQKITPQIGVQSKLIEEGFKKDMNFRILHAGFEKLSSTFSEIISLVIRLEKTEKRANKGNLFDSVKYINSLRSDIITPLTSLKVFLEKQRDELIVGQEELTTVRIKVGGEKGEGNLDLASKRNISLLQELERNIKALDRMIGKIG